MAVYPWIKIREEPVRVGYRKIKRCLFQFPDGRQDIYDLMDEGRVVCVLALTPDRPAPTAVILARQYRPGPDEILLELPGGGVEAGETPEQAARRELLEETGYEGELHLAGQSWHCGYSSRQIFNFVATNCRQVQAQTLDLNENIEVVMMPLAAFREHLRNGHLSDVATGYQCLDFLGLL